MTAVCVHGRQQVLLLLQFLLLKGGGINLDKLSKTFCATPCRSSGRLSRDPRHTAHSLKGGRRQAVLGFLNRVTMVSSWLRVFAKCRWMLAARIYHHYRRRSMVKAQSRPSSPLLSFAVEVVVGKGPPSPGIAAEHGGGRRRLATLAR